MMMWVYWWRKYLTELQAQFIVDQLREYYLYDGGEIIEYLIFKTARGEFRIKYIVKVNSLLTT